MKMGGKTRMDVGTVFFMFGILALIAAGIMMIKKEDTDFKTFIDMVGDIKIRMDTIEKSVSTLADNGSKQCGSLEAQIVEIKSQTDRIEQVSKTPLPVSVTFPRNVPVSLVYEKKQELGKGKSALLDRAGITKKILRPKDNN